MDDDTFKSQVHKIAAAVHTLYDFGARSPCSTNSTEANATKQRYVAFATQKHHHHVLCGLACSTPALTDPRCTISKYMLIFDFSKAMFAKSIELIMFASSCCSEVPETMTACRVYSIMTSTFGEKWGPVARTHERENEPGPKTGEAANAKLPIHPHLRLLGGNRSSKRTL